MYVQQHKHEILQYSCMLTSTWTLLFYIISNSGRWKYFTKISVSPNIFFCHVPHFWKKVFLFRQLFVTLEKCARFSRGRNFARARRAPKFFLKKFEFIDGLNICKNRMAGKILDRPGNGRFHGIYRSLARLGPKNHIPQIMG